MSKKQNRRDFFTSLAGVSAITMLSPFQTLMATERNKVVITDINCDL